MEENLSKTLSYFTILIRVAYSSTNRMRKALKGNAKWMEEILSLGRGRYFLESKNMENAKYDGVSEGGSVFHATRIS